MKKILTLLVVASAGFAAVGCDPKPSDDPNATAPNAKPSAPPAKAEAPAKAAS